MDLYGVMVGVSELLYFSLYMARKNTILFKRLVCKRYVTIDAKYDPKLYFYTI